MSYSTYAVQAHPHGKARAAALVIALVAALVMIPLSATSTMARPLVPPGDRAVPGSAIALVPLDDRPANLYTPEMAAASAGIETRLPPRSTLGRFLDPGDGAAIAEWLTEQGDVDAYVVSVSMLAYGGLVASRTPAQTLDQARANVQALRQVRQQQPDSPILVHDVIQRLSPTLTGDNQQYAARLVEWAQLYDRVVNLGQEEYREQLEEVRAQIPDDVVGLYLAARERNHEINKLMVRWVVDGTISHLVLSEDDTAVYGFSRAERVELQRLVSKLGVESRVEIYPGADEVEEVLIGRYAAASLHRPPTVAVHYSGMDADDWIPDFESIPFGQNIRRHLKTVGSRVVDARPDVHLFVNTPSADPDARAHDLDRFVTRIGNVMQRGADVIVADTARTNRADHQLVALLEERVDLTGLLSYSGFNTAGNALGLALGHGVSRWAYLEAPPPFERAGDLLRSGRAQVETLLSRFVDDDPWRNVVQPAAYQHAQDLGWNAFSFTPDQEQYFDDWVAERLVPITEQYFGDHFDRRTVVLQHAGPVTLKARIDDLESVHVDLPWPRLFETQLEPTVDLHIAPPGRG